jgi:hypothetical protein
MKIFIDADGCPVVRQTVEIAKRNKIEVIIFCDTSHIINYPDVETITVSKGADSVDFALVNQVRHSDIVVTQDYGLAAMVLSKGGLPITQNGLVINDDNLTTLLTTRHESKKARMAGVHLKGPKKRSKENDDNFVISLNKLIKSQ